MLMVSAGLIFMLMFFGGFANQMGSENPQIGFSLTPNCLQTNVKMTKSNRFKLVQTQTNGTQPNPVTAPNSVTQPNPVTEPNLTPNCLQTNAKMIQFKSLQASPDTNE